MADFLFEIGLEEVPARMIAQAEAELLRRTVGLLERERLVSGEVEAKSYSTPRRLAVVVRGVLARQEDVSEEVLGPATKIAFKDGQPGPAAMAFAKKAGVDVSALRTVTNAKGEYVAATSVKAGRSAAEVIAEELPKEIAGIYWAKNMYWRAGRPERFVRPVRWLVALLGEEVVPVSFGGYQAGNVTYGHRVLFGDTPVVVTAANYVEELAKASVMVDVEARRHLIRKALDKICRTAEGTRWREDHGLVDKMTHMTEWPSVILGGFEKEYLALPEEVLVTVMRDHQNYFAVETADGKLAPHFLAVLNTLADEAGQAVIRHGNERVLRARFNDARFFWEFDQRVSLEDRVGLLENVTFQKDLGSYAAKSVRVREVCRRLIDFAEKRGVAVEFNALMDAAGLAKTDLTTELVKEFTELQGEIGGLYARAQGIRPAACDAIYDQYHPISMEDRIPRTIEGQLLAIADKADTISGMFGLGLEPTGSKDPFALRRAANGIVKILGESQLLSGPRLGELIAACDVRNELTEDKMAKFFIERLEFYLRERCTVAIDVVRAVMSATGRLPDDVKDVIARANALKKAKSSDDFSAVCAAFKRMKNILVQARNGGEFEGEFVGEVRGTLRVQRELFERATGVAQRVENFAKVYDYETALREIASLRPYVDAFFDEVLVMDLDRDLRLGRLKLLEIIVSRFSQIADFSEIVVAG